MFPLCRRFGSKIERLGSPTKPSDELAPGAVMPTMLDNVHRRSRPSSREAMHELSLPPPESKILRRMDGFRRATMRRARSLATCRLRLLDGKALLAVLEELRQLSLEIAPIDEGVGLACLPCCQLVGHREHASNRWMDG